MSADITPDRARAWLDVNDCDDGVCSLDEGIAFASAYVDVCEERDRYETIIREVGAEAFMRNKPIEEIHEHFVRVMKSHNDQRARKRTR